MAKQETTKTRTFEIPKEFIGTFFSQLEDSELDYELIEVDEENEELIIEVEYAPTQRDEVMNLIESLDDYLEELEDASENDEDQ